MLGKIEAGKEDTRRWDRRMEPTTPRILDWKLWDCAKDTEACRVAVHRVAKRGTLVTTQLTWNEWIHAYRGIPRAHHSHPNTLLETCLPTYPLPFRGLPSPDPCLRTTPPQTTRNPCLNFALQWGPLQFLCFLTGHSPSVQGPGTKRCRERGTYAFLPSGPLVKPQSELIPKGIGLLQLWIPCFSSFYVSVAFCPSFSFFHLFW